MKTNFILHKTVFFLQKFEFVKVDGQDVDLESITQKVFITEWIWGLLLSPYRIN